ncbi:hypothetical protein [Streptomyces buecherae]|uniref:Tetratricopeptide repeat protein n=1 Tax=Streptomyces buecherae TaxID=2763006 RepID=A0A7H8N8V2_9ACTN|nr:hypothetical protein [Streptomyces buecherae]QKW50843.1 hypothetical protein HUT08_16340 [Streptomyces buecherae]
MVEAERIAVPPLRERDAVKMLRKVAGPEAVAQARPRLPGVLASCAGNPFALKIAAMRLLTEESGPAGGGNGTGGEGVPTGSDPAHCLGALERWEEADRAASAAVASERAAGHLLGEASCVEMRGLLRLNRWSYEAAYEHFMRAERVYRRIGAGQEGAGDLGRALALAARHQGRALRGMGRLEESRVRLERARDFFAGGSGAEREPYNEARALTDLAETLLDGGDTAAALAAIAEAEPLLTPQRATPHLRYLDQLRRRCQAVA